MPPAEPRRTFVLVDGENIDATLSNYVLERAPRKEDRPRWNRVREFAVKSWGAPAEQVLGLFFLNASRGIHGGFVQALRFAGFAPVPLRGAEDESVVDLGLCRTLQALRGEPCDLLLVSHDGGYAEDMRALAEDGAEHRLGVLCFPEYLSGKLQGLSGVSVHDLELDADAFDREPLPRLRIVDVRDFDPVAFFDEAARLALRAESGSGFEGEP